MSARASNMVALTTCVPSDILPYIHQFLEDNGFSKTAKYLRKESKLAVPVAPVNPTLIDIFNNFFNTTEESTNPLQQVNDDDETKNTVEREKTKKKSKRKRQVSELMGYEELNTKKQKPDTDEIDDEGKENDKAEELVPGGKKNKGRYYLLF